MKQLKLNIQQQIVASFICLILILASCQTDETTYNTQKKGAIITLKLTDTKDVMLRSAATTNERTIEDLYVLVFRKADSNAPYTYCAGEKADVSGSLLNNGEQTATLKTDLELQLGDKVIVLCNTKVASLPSFVVGVDTESEINKKLLSQNWNMNSLNTSNGKGIPMSGQIDSWAGDGNSCNLKRSILKIQVAVSIGTTTSSDLSGGFTAPALDNIRWGVYNQLIEGNIYMENEANITSPASRTFQNNLIDLKVDGGIQYLPESENSIKAKSSDVSKNTFHADRTCVILKTVVASKENYYRIDFYSDNQFLDLVRNHHYTVTITKVRSQGYATIKEALDNLGSNIEYTILVDDEKSNIISSNGQYAIAVNSDKINIYGGAKTFDITTVRGLNLPAGNAISTNKIEVPAGMTLVTPADGKITADLKTIQVNFASSGKITGVITLKLGNITKELTVTKEPYQYKKVTIFGAANQLLFGYNISIKTAGSYKVLTAATNFGPDGIVSTETPVFFDPQANSDGYLTTHLLNAITSKVDIIVLAHDLYLNASEAKKLSDYVKAGGVLVCFYEGNGYFDDLNGFSNGSTSFLMREIFGKPTIYSTLVNIGAGYRYTMDRTNKISNNDPILVGPFGDVRGKEWGEDASYARAVIGLPTDKIDVYSDAFTSVFPIETQNQAFANYVTGFKHKEYNLVYFGDGGFTSGYIDDGSKESETICPFMWESSTMKPIPKQHYGITIAGGYTQQPVYNSIVYANVMAWAIERATNHGINTPK